MNKKIKKFTNRVIARIYKYTKNNHFRIFMMNLTTKLFIDKHNKIEYDDKNKLFWLKNNKQYLFAVDKPYFDFEKNKINNVFLSIFCHHYVPQKEDVIIDIGAGIGRELNFFERKIKNNGKIFCIEASPRSFKKLELLKQKNIFNNCYTFNLAISDKNEEIWMEEEENYLINKINKEAKGIKIQAKTLDKFVSDNNIPRVDLLKVNIEGAEYEMVDGMKDSVGIIKNIAVSCHDFLIDGKEDKIRKKVESFLIKNDFEFFYRNTGNKILDSWIYGKNRMS